MASVEVNQMLSAAAAACEDKKAEDIRILALDPTESGLTDYFLICTGTNDRQTVAITDEIELRLKREFATYPNSVEGRQQGEWVLMDYVDFIVHVFLPEKRAYYGLERLRPSATTLSIADLNVEVKEAITAKRPVKVAEKATKRVAKGAPKAKDTLKVAGSKKSGAGAVGAKRATFADAAGESETRTVAAVAEVDLSPAKTSVPRSPKKTAARSKATS